MDTRDYNEKMNWWKSLSFKEKQKWLCNFIKNMDEIKQDRKKLHEFLNPNNRILEPEPKPEKKTNDFTPYPDPHERRYTKCNVLQWGEEIEYLDPELFFSMPSEYQNSSKL